MNSKKLIVVIPARFGSSRLPGKPLVELYGLPMIVRVFRQAAAAFPSGTEIVVATDDTRISDVLDGFSIPYVMTRVEHESGTDRIAEVVKTLDLADSDIVINLQGDEPLVPPEMLTGFANFCLGKSDFEMATISAPVTAEADIYDRNTVKLVAGESDNALYFSRSAIPCIRDVDDGPLPLAAFKKHVGVYAYSCSTLLHIAGLDVVELEKYEKLEQLRALSHGVKISIFPWHRSPPHGVDTVEDVERVEKLLEELG